MNLPAELIHSLQNTEGFTKEAFEKVHASGNQVTSIRTNPIKWKTSNRQSAIGNPFRESQFTGEERVPWTEYGYYLQTRPSFTFDPLFHAGCYYVQEASSMFLELALKQTTDLSKSLKILDLSAAPGGKSTHILSLISKESLLVSNEVVRQRANVLADNIIKWGQPNVLVTHNDPVDFSRLENYFDVIVVDAPCSGSGLFRRDPEAIAEWSEQNVRLCSLRQQRILNDVWPALKKEGILIYSTCSYSKEEDEDIAFWMEKNISLAYCKLSIDPQWGIVETDKGYRFWPDKVKGEGFFLAVYKKQGGETQASQETRSRLSGITNKEKNSIENWARSDGFDFIKYENTVYAWPAHLIQDFHLILDRLRVIYSGIRVGELVRDKLIPDHALALSELIRDAIPRFALEREEAIAYLKRKELNNMPEQKGWQLVTYEDHILGWINALPNRINNYYPKRMRILKDN